MSHPRAEIETVARTSERCGLVLGQMLEVTLMTTKVIVPRMAAYRYICRRSSWLIMPAILLSGRQGAASLKWLRTVNDAEPL